MRSVMLIDDCNTVHVLLRKLLEKSYDFHAFKSWSAAFGYLSDEEPDLILLDVNLQGFQGDEIAKMLDSSSARRSKSKIVFFSAMPEADLQQLANISPVDGYLQKNLPPNLLRAHIDRFLRTPRRQFAGNASGFAGSLRPKATFG